MELRLDGGWEDGHIPWYTGAGAADRHLVYTETMKRRSFVALAAATPLLAQTVQAKPVQDLAGVGDLFGLEGEYTWLVTVGGQPGFALTEEDHACIDRTPRWAQLPGPSELAKRLATTNPAYIQAALDKGLTVHCGLELEDGTAIRTYESEVISPLRNVTVEEFDRQLTLHTFINQIYEPGSGVCTYEHEDLGSITFPSQKNYLALKQRVTTIHLWTTP